MENTPFIDPDDIIIQIEDKYGYEEPPVSVNANIHYYEWNAHDQAWVRLNPKSPDPPDNLAPGQFDGQITEIRHDADG